MSVKLRRPILLCGVGLSFALWLLQGWHDSVAKLGELSLVSAIALIVSLWLFQQFRVKSAVKQLESVTLDRVAVEKAIAQAEGVVNQLATEAVNHQANAQLQQKVAQLKTEIDRQQIRCCVTGGKAVGKTSLIQQLETWVPPAYKLCWNETPALLTNTSDNALQQAIASDLVVFVTNGDLTESEFQALQQIAALQQRLILVLNKQDQYLPDEQVTVLHSLQQRVQPLLRLENVVAIAASPSPIKVRQHQVDNSAQEWMEQRPPEVNPLTQQLEQILVQEAKQLVWATAKRAAENLKVEAKTVLNQVRRDRALPAIEQYQWIAAAAAFVNPVPALDLLATAAINAQMVMDLSSIYQQKLSLQQAQAVAGTMGSLMLKLGLVELSTKTIGTVLKSNAVTFVAGGMVQGVSAAYLTRLAGCSLIEYFQAQELSTNAETKLNLDKLGQTLQKVFQQNQQSVFLQGFVKQSLGRLLPKSPQPEVSALQ